MKKRIFALLLDLGVWGAIGGHLVYMELSFGGEDYNLYSVPILLNGDAYHLQTTYDFPGEEWFILGASPGLDDSGMAAKELRLLEPPSGSWPPSAGRMTLRCGIPQAAAPIWTLSPLIVRAARSLLL